MLTAIPVGLGAWWLFLLLCMLWRRTVWQRAGASIRELAGGGGVQPLWFGYAVQRGQSTVSWFGGLRGARTTVRGVDGQVISHDGWLEPDEVLAQLNP